jgi:pimeloyl-ACP methyl ester carboxylesterase
LESGLLYGLPLKKRLKLLTLNTETRASLQGSFVNIPSGTTHYDLSNLSGKDPVVLVHGFSTPYYIWDPTFKALSAAGFSVLRYDLLGRGYSDRPRTVYNLDLFVSQLSQLIDYLNIKKPFHLIGLSFGSWISTQYSNHFPENVNSLTLISPLVSGKPLSKNSVLNIPWIGEMFFHGYFSRFVLSQNQSSDFFDANLHPDWEEKFKDQMRYRGFNQAILSTYRQIRHVDWRSIYGIFSQQDIPLQIYWGEEDQTINRGEIACLQQSVTNSQLIQINHAGHIPHYEMPEVVSVKLIEFLEKIK